MKLEVRCCCDASKVLGHLEHPQLQKAGDRATFVVVDNRRLPDIVFVPGEGPRTAVPTRVLELEVAYITLHPFDFDSIAIKNRDYPLEDLKFIPGFEPLTWEP